MSEKKPEKQKNESKPIENDTLLESNEKSIDSKNESNFPTPDISPKSAEEQIENETAVQPIENIQNPQDDSQQTNSVKESTQIQRRVTRSSVKLQKQSESLSKDSKPNLSNHQDQKTPNATISSNKSHLSKTKPTLNQNSKAQIESESDTEIEEEEIEEEEEEEEDVEEEEIKVEILKKKSKRNAQSEKETTNRRQSPNSRIQNKQSTRNQRNTKQDISDSKRNSNRTSRSLNPRYKDALKSVTVRPKNLPKYEGPVFRNSPLDSDDYPKDLFLWAIGNEIIF